MDKVATSYVRASERNLAIFEAIYRYMHTNMILLYELSPKNVGKSATDPPLPNLLSLYLIVHPNQSYSL